MNRINSTMAKDMHINRHIFVTRTRKCSHSLGPDMIQTNAYTEPNAPNEIPKLCGAACVRSLNSCLILSRSYKYIYSIVHDNNVCTQRHNENTQKS